MPSREELWDLLAANGAQTKDVMAKYVDLLLIGEGYGKTKIEKALKWGCPTISLPMADYLGFFQPHGNFKLDPQLKATLPQLVLMYAFIIELTYGKFVRSHGRGEPEARHWLGAFYQLAAGFDELLRVTWGDPDGDGTSAPNDLSDLLREFESLRSDPEAKLRFEREYLGTFEGANS